MWRVWMLFDPRRALIAVLTFAFFMVLVNHFVQLSTPRYGSWLSGDGAESTAAVVVEPEDSAPVVALAQQ
ncbi:MAG: light-harvesting antenna LH1, alpha subunit [Steroidobacteraceae bacterium]